MTQLTILLVESNLPEAAQLTATLEALGFLVQHATTLQFTSDFLASHEPVHIVLGNWNQHGFGGQELAALIQGRSRVLLPMVLYGRSVTREDLSVAKDAGVSVLLNLPLLESDLYQCLTRILKARYPWAHHRSVVGDIEMDKETHVVTRRGRRVHLTPSDFRLLEVFLRRPGEVLSREILLGVISSQEGAGIRTVDVRVQRLKAALTVDKKAPPIRAIRGKGYLMEA